MLPRSLTVLGYTWKIKRTKNLADEDGEPCDGTTDVVKRVIELDSRLSPEERKQVLLHELVHVVVNEAMPDVLTDEQEERLARAIEHGLYPVLPKIFR